MTLKIEEKLKKEAENQNNVHLYKGFLSLSLKLQQIVNHFRKMNFLHLHFHNLL